MTKWGGMKTRNNGRVHRLGVEARIGKYIFINTLFVNTLMCNNFFQVS